MVVPVRTPQVKYDSFRLSGGLDLITPTLSLPPGVARESLNFEVSTTGGYTRIAGYERFDGRASPNAAQYTFFDLTTVDGLAVGNTIQNLAGTVTGVVIFITGNTVFYTKAVGAFTNGTTVYVGATPIGAVQSSSYFVTTQTRATLLALAADVYRADIAAVPGSGPIRGTAFLNNTIYAWRNNGGGTAMGIYRSTTSGWTAVSLGFELAFNTGGTSLIVEGDTVTGQTSGATGVVSRVVLQSGTWSGGNAAGRLILSSTTGTFVATEHLRVGGTTRAHAGGAATAITLQPNGRVETVTANLGGAIGSTRLYGADGVNKGFEFDGTVYVPIVTGMANDTPDHVAVQKNYLFLSFGPSLQNSGVGAPYVWSPVFGASELLVPENITCLQAMPGDAATASLGIYTKNNTHVLYGTSSSTWNLVPFDKGTGAAPYTTQTLTDAYSLDDRGVVALATTRNFGNFDSATLTFPIRPFVAARRGLATASGLNREKSQYRVFYSDGYGLYVTVVNGRMKGAMPVLFNNPVTTWCEGETGAGEEYSFFGSTNGFVYKMDIGPDFDSAPITASMLLNFNPEGAARVLKRYRRASLEVTGTGYSTFDFGYQLGYNTIDIDQPGNLTYSVPLASANWDAFFWDSFTWDSRGLAPVEIQCDGTAENIAVAVQSSSRYNQPFTINSVTLHYTFRRGIR